MRGQLGIIEAVELRAEIHVGSFGGAVLVMMEMAFLHRHVALVIEHDDEDREIVLLGGAERLDDRIIEEAAVADQQRYRPLARGELDAERGADALAEAAEAAEEAVRCVERQMLAERRTMHDGL